MDFGNNLKQIRKKKKLRQSDLGKIIGTSGDVIGRYERGDRTPSIEVVAKIAHGLEVSVDSLIGKASLISDKETLLRIEDISKLKEEDKNYIFNLIDRALKEMKAKKA